MSKKRILIVSKFLYVRGGAEVVALAEADLLRRAGYEVELWGMDYPDNQPVAMADTLASRVVFDGGVADKFRASLRVMGRRGVRRSFAEALRRFRPDTVHFHNIHSYLSPAVVEMAKAAGCRTLWTMHDYKLACPSYLCLRPDGTICTECIGHPSAVIRHRCMRGSLAASIMARAESAAWPVSRLASATDVFICPSSFIASLLAKAGVPAGKTAVVCNFLDPRKTAILASLPADAPRQKGLLIYAGRLSPEKGVATMLEAFASLADPALTLRVFGAGPLEAGLRDRFGSTPGVEFRGHAEAEVIAAEMACAEAVLCPSECYENNPLSVIEALSAGTPVLGAEIGGIPELLTPSCGILFRPGSPCALADGIRAMRAREWDNAAIRAEALDRFSESRHLNLLEKLL